jgi:hypothetical protein
VGRADQACLRRLPDGRDARARNQAAKTMSARAIKFPTKRTSYIRVRGCAVQLVTPCEGGRSIVTRLATASTPAGAIHYATETGRAMALSVRLPGQRGE